MGTWARLRACRKATCRFAYYDRTKNGSRAWCSMSTCGNQEKAQRRRQRERHAHG
jgi:predicted RNA-binding Zn ribbon-like protein